MEGFFFTMFLRPHLFLPLETTPFIRSLAKNVSSISQAVQALHHQGLDDPLHSFLPGDWVLVKSWTDSGPLAECYKGPFIILLMTHTAVKVAGICTWIHCTHLKPPSPPDDTDENWTVAPGAEDNLGLKLLFK